MLPSKLSVRTLPFSHLPSPNCTVPNPCGPTQLFLSFAIVRVECAFANQVGEGMNSCWKGDG